MRSFEGKVAIVTGASRGIGHATALRLCQAGAAVAMVARDARSLQVAAASAAGVARPFACDLTSGKAIQRLTRDVLSTLGHVDILVHSAGVITTAPLESAALVDFDAHYAANVRGPYELTQNVLPALKASRGHVIFVNSSITRATQLAERGQYAAMQQAMKAIADSLRDEVNEHGVRVTSVFPGTTATPRQQLLHETAGRDYRPERLLQPDDVADAIVAALVAKSTAEVTDIYLRPMLKPLP
jgi:NADP-dependent 3-hydroxy acid dehydrogenase YdfG